MISLHGEATRGAFPMSSTNSYCHYLIIRIHKMLKKLTSRNPNQRRKVKLALRTLVVLAVGVWMIYQLRAFLSHKLSSANGVPVKKETQTEQLKLGRKGLILTDSETRKPDEIGEGGVEDMEEEEKRKEKHENQQEMGGQSEDLVDGVDKGGDVDDEELDTMRFDDPMEDIESLDDGDDDEGDDNPTTDQHSEGEDDKVDTKINEVNSR